jgi:ribosomal protein S5
MEAVCYFIKNLSMNLQLATLSLHLVKHSVTKNRGIVEVELRAFLFSAPLGTGHFITGRKVLGACKCLGVHDVWRGEFNPEPSAALWR